jgi:hypothetical protein
LAKFIAKYFILFDAIVNGITFLISFSNTSLLIDRNETFIGWFEFTEFVYSNSF